MQSIDSLLQDIINGKHISRGLCLAAMLQTGAQAAEGCLCNLQDFSIVIIATIMMLRLSSS